MTTVASEVSSTSSAPPRLSAQDSEQHLKEAPTQHVHVFFSLPSAKAREAFLQASQDATALLQESNIRYVSHNREPHHAADNTLCQATPSAGIMATITPA